MAELDLRLDELFHLCESKGKGRCPVRFCRNCSRKDGRLCHTHHKAAWRKRNPIRAAWQTLRHHAVRRKLAFDIPLEAFIEICNQTGYHHAKGSRPEDLAIDRIKNWLGYTLDNIRVVTVAVNGAKGYLEKRLKLSSGQEVLWDEIGIDQFMRRENDRVDAHNTNPYAVRKAAPDATAESEPAVDEEEELPAWLLLDDSADPF